MKATKKIAIKRILFVLGVLVAITGVAFRARPISFFNEWTDIGMYFSGTGSNSVTVAGHRVHYFVAGPADGKPVVLVHGLGGRAEDWRNLAPILTRWGFRVYLPDLPGYGQSEQPRDFSYSVHDEAEAVVGFLDALRLHQVDLGGWSMGGGIAQHVAARHPERVRRLMLFDSVGIYETPKWDVNLFMPKTPADLDQLDALLMPNPPQVPAYIARDILRRSKKNAWVIHRAIDSMMTGNDATEKMMPDLKMPVLLVWGSEDRITPLSQGKKMNQLIPQSQLGVFQGCGHLAPTQCANDIGPVVVEFLEQ
jgi:pimeloyl-ACP methyl ester carboxylesterase